jgi:hypothetical protein
VSDILGLALGTHTLVVGVEDDASGALRVYLGARWKNVYCLIDNEVDKDAVRRAWSHQGHVTIPIPPADRLYVDAPSPAGALVSGRAREPD